MDYICPFCLEWISALFHCDCIYEDEPIRMDGLTDYEFWQSRQDDSFEQMFQEQIIASLDEFNEKKWEQDNKQQVIRLKTGVVAAICERGGRHYTRNKSMRWLKRQTNKAMRRMARQDPENAPTRMPFSGWVY